MHCSPYDEWASEGHLRSGRAGFGVLQCMDHDIGLQLVHDVQRIGHVPPTSIRVVRTGSLPIVTLTGHHDLGTAPALRDALGPELGERRPCVIDLRGASLVDSAVLSVFNDASRLSRELGLEMPVVLNGNRGSGCVAWCRRRWSPSAPSTTSGGRRVGPAGSPSLSVADEICLTKVRYRFVPEVIRTLK